MRRIRLNMSKRIGMAPGSIIEEEEDATLGPPELSLFRYTAEDAERKELVSFDDFDGLREEQRNIWLNLSGLHDAKLLKRLTTLFGVHPIAAEDIQHTVQRPKAEEFGNQLFLVMRMLMWNPEEKSVESEQVSIVSGDGYVVSFQERPGDVFDSVRRRLLDGLGRIRTMGSDYLAYALADAVVDNYFLVLEALQEQYEELEERVLFGSGGDPSDRVHSLTHALLSLRRAVWPMREAASTLMRGQIPSVSPEVQVFFRDLYDHIVQMMDWVELLRDSLKGLVDSYQARVSNSTNEVMRLLTIIATIFIPLTFIAGIYGMNFERMPELAWRWGYPAVLGIMVAIGAGMLIYFKRKKWL